MQKKMKRMLAVATAVAVMLVAVTVPNFAASVETSGDAGTGYTFTVGSATNDEDIKFEAVQVRVKEFTQTITMKIVNNSDKEIRTVRTSYANKYGPSKDGGSVPSSSDFWGKYANISTTYESGITLIPGEEYTFYVTTSINTSIVEEYGKGVYDSLDACFGLGVSLKSVLGMPSKYEINKVWDHGDNKDRPESVGVQLYNGNTPVSDVMRLNEANGWKVKTEKYITGSAITVKEVDVPEGYEATYTNDGTSNGTSFGPNDVVTSFTVTNTWVGIPEEASKYTVAYDKNTEDEVTGMPGDATEVEEGDYTLSTDIPTRAGFEFKGWAETKDSKDAVTTINVTADATVYAIWEAKKVEPPIVDPVPPVVVPPVTPEVPVIPPVIIPPEDTDTPDDNNNAKPPSEEEGEDTDTPDDNNNAKPPVNEGTAKEDTDVNEAENNNSDQPKTGDASQMALYIILAGGAAAALGVIARKKNEVK